MSPNSLSVLKRTGGSSSVPAAFSLFGSRTFDSTFSSVVWLSGSCCHRWNYISAHWSIQPGFVAYGFADRSSPPTDAPCNFQRYLTVTWSGCCFHFFGHLKPSISTALLKSYPHLMLWISYLILLLTVMALAFLHHTQRLSAFSGHWI